MPVASWRPPRRSVRDMCRAAADPDRTAPSTGSAASATSPVEFGLTVDLEFPSWSETRD